VRACPAGSTVAATVVAHRPFGFFVRLDGLEHVKALVEIPEYRRDLTDRASVEFPPVGSRVEVTVLHHKHETEEFVLSVEP
jgi:predicted RNA-binding protein with RPS1 domain